MKVLKKYHDSLYKVEKWHIRHADLEFLYVHNPHSVEFDIGLVLNAGSMSAHSIDLPAGTAHMLEHMLLGVNNRFKTIAELKEFKRGTKKRPALYINGSSGYLSTHYYSYINIAGKDRAVEYIASLMNDHALTKEKLDKEKNVVLAELTSQSPSDMDYDRHWRTYWIGENFDKYALSTLGTQQSIRDMTVDDIQSMFRTFYGMHNMVIVIQSPEPLAEKFIHHISGRLDGIPKGERIKIAGPPENTQRADYQIYVDSDSDAVRMNIGVETLINKERNYTEEVAMDMVMSYVIERLTDELRNRQEYIYAMRSFEFEYSLARRVGGIALETSMRNAADVVDYVRNYMSFDLLEELRDGTDFAEFLEESISRILYPFTPAFYSSYDYGNASDLLSGREYWDAYYEALRTVTRQDIYRFAENFFPAHRVYIWCAVPKKRHARRMDRILSGATSKWNAIAV